MTIAIGTRLEIALVCNLQGQTAMNVWQYEVNAISVLANAADYGNAWWQHVKALYRAVPTVEFTGLFRSVKVREMDSATGEYGEYSIPSGEQAGTRVSGGGSELMPPFVGAGVRLTVGTRLTRPGQKRFFGFVESDNVSGYVNTSAATAITNLMNLMVANMTLGAPAALAILDPVVVRVDANNIPVAHQPVTGYVSNPAFTSQVSRKFGRGA